MQDLFFNQNSDGITGTAELGDGFGLALGNGDFNGDDRSDLTIGIPGEDFVFNAVNEPNAGVVSVLYGSLNGPSGSNDDYWHQGFAGIADDPHGDAAAEFNTSDFFGRSLGSGDFDGDGFDDLAVGVPGEGITFVNITPIAGAVNVLYGSNSGLTTSGSQFWHQNSQQNGIHIRGGSEYQDRFGSSLATGDFDGDGFDDLAAGVPGESIVFGGNTFFGAGAVNVLYGSGAGLTAASNQIWHQNSQQDGIHIRGGSEQGDNFGKKLAVGDFDGNGFDDLAAGVPGESIVFNGNESERAGAVNVLYGSKAGLTANGNQIWHQNSQKDGIHIQGGSEPVDAFGGSLAVGDFNDDGKDDLVIGVPGEALGNMINAGAVNVLYGSNDGLSAVGNQIWHQNSAGVKGTAQAGEYFGSSVTTGDFDDDGYDDLAIGTPYDRVGGIIAGSVNILYGSADGLNANGDQLFHQNSPGVKDSINNVDQFGKSLGSADYNGDGFDDLAIGVPGEDILGIMNAGAVHIIFGSNSGLVA